MTGLVRWLWGPDAVWYDPVVIAEVYCSLALAAWILGAVIRRLGRQGAGR